ncbi:MAG TPA: cytochrome c [Cyclobacteriaceae bacterium]
MKRTLKINRIMRVIRSLTVGATLAIALAGCKAGGDNPGLEYAPNMYHSVPYDPLTQITDEDAGWWLTSIEYSDGHAEFYNSNKLNPHAMNMRVPPANTIKRGRMPYRIPKDSLEYADRLVNPLDSSAAIIAQGKALYMKYCNHCHGPQGKGDGPVAEKYAGVANLTSDALKGISEGHIFHVITHGKGLMWAHGSQVSPEDRWKIAKFVKTLK